MTLTDRTLRLAVAPVALVATLATATAAAEPAAAPARSTENRVLSDPEITESSGLARSGLRRPVLFTHNDSGDVARVFAVRADGSTRGELRLRGVSAVDWEDISTGPGRTLWIGDIGDNGSERSTITVHRITEPRKLSRRWTKPQSYRFSYPDGPRDAEALLVRPRTGRLFIVTKRDEGAGIYRAPKRLSTDRVNRLSWVRSAPAAVTGGSFSPGGQYLLLGTYTDAWAYRSLRGTPQRIDLPSRRQGESLEILRGGRTLVVGSEGSDSPVHAVPVPRSIRQPARRVAPRSDRRLTPRAADLEATDTTGAGPAADLPGWVLNLSEEFNDPDGLDGAVWNVRDETYNANEQSHLLAANTSVRGGELRIEARKQRAGRRPYTSGYVDTNGTYALPDHFRVEVRAKVPMEQGMWAAPLWLRPSDHSGGEIDLVETYGADRNDPRVHQTIHTHYGSGHRQATDAVRYADLGDPAGTGWHTYVAEKTPGRITMYTDGVETARYSSGNPGWFDRYYEAGKMWELRINLQVGGDRGGPPDRSTDWSRTAMLIDYVRTWVPS